MESDFLVPVGKSLIQHGYYNNRIYLINMVPVDIEKIKERINYLQLIYSYEKIILKIPRSYERDFSTPDTRLEATIPGYYQGREDALFLARFFTATRADDNAFLKIKRIIERCEDNTFPSVHKKFNRGITIRRADFSDIPGLSKLYQNVFQTYPFPISEPHYLKTIMEIGVPFYIAVTAEEIIAAGSCELDSYASAVEMSDLAVDPKYQGYGLSKEILLCMEDMMQKNRVKSAYTICRAESLQVNRLFSGFGYQYGGTLIKNTNISGKTESMNVWYKPLSS